MMRSHHRFAAAVLLVSFAACSSEVATEDGRNQPDPACSSGCGDAGTSNPGASGSGGGDSGSLPPVPSDDLIGHWKLDETTGTTASDASGFDRAATITGATWTPGLADGSLAFDGAGDSMTVSDFAYGPELTLSFWFKIADNSGSVVQYLFNHGEQSQPNSVRVFLFRDGDTTGNAGKLRTIVRDADDAADVELDVPSGLADGAWHLYTLVLSPGSGSTVYVDGIERAASSQVGGGAIDPATPLYFGARADQEADRFLDGGLDDVRLYDRALSSDEIQALFAAQDPGPPVDPPPEQPPPTGGAIDAADILHEAQAEVPFSQHSGYSGQVLGTYPSCKSIPEYPGGIMGSQLPNGETIRMGKVLDPEDASKKVFVFQLSPNDPSTSGSKRCEFAFSKNVGLGEVYWVALSVYVYDWGSLASNDKSLFGTQLHSGDNSLGLSPSFSIVTTGSGNRSFESQGRYQTNLGSKPSQSNSTTIRSDAYEIAFGQWMDFVIKFKQSTGNDGFLQAWYDGQLIYDYQGRLGFETPGHLDYIKFGYYNWSSGFDSPRKLLLRSPMLVRDPTGNKYAPEDLRAYVQQH